MSRKLPSEFQYFPIQLLIMKIQFYLRFCTQYGQNMFITGNHKNLGNSNVMAAFPMQYLTDEFWTATIEVDNLVDECLQYSYILKNENGEVIREWEKDRVIEVSKINHKELTVIDTWNDASEIENAFYTQAFQETLLPKHKQNKASSFKNITHCFKVKAPLLHENEVLVLTGNNETLGNWQTFQPIILKKEGNWWVARVHFSNENFPIAYKYGVYNTLKKEFVQFESGCNRGLFDSDNNRLTVLHDGFVKLPANNWRGAGVAIPVFSLRSSRGLGVGEFSDLKLLVDWAKKVGIKLIQILPINDTTANHTKNDSYPYAAISAFALHPQYLNLEMVAKKATHPVIKALKQKQIELNALPTVDYEAVMTLKWAAVKELYEEQKADFQADDSFSVFFEKNKTWLIPYAAFSYLRDKYKTPNFNHWKTHRVYNEQAIRDFVSPTQKHYNQIAIHYFIQYHLHLQLCNATNYAHENGIIVKGDIPIGIYRNSCDAWVEPLLYNMQMQAGAPPDDFAIKGQNWGFPTYNWHKMAEDGFKWWRLRFEQMGNYFDAFRIDHILGFFRIWSIPTHAVEGIMGYFVPAQPVHINDLNKQGIAFNYQRFCYPFINEQVLHQLMGGEVDLLMPFLNSIGDGQFELKDEFNTQRKVEAYFDTKEQNEQNHKIKLSLYDCISNVILFEVDGTQSQQFHFRINVSETSSFQNLDEESRYKLERLYVHYFYHQQDNLWRKEALAKIPFLKQSTDMLVCGEDLGMVPNCVPDVMKQLGLLSLEIQRMPKASSTQFFNPKNAPYLSVVSPSTHDMSTLRGWWEEDRLQTQSFYTNVLGLSGNAPQYCEPRIVSSIIKQHLFSPAMWSIFQIQELLGMNDKLRRENPHDERINIPANPNHYWCYRLHLSLEQLLKEDEFNADLKANIAHSGRC